MQMRPKERREMGEQDLFRSRLDQIIDMEYASVKLARSIDWRFLEERFGAVYTDTRGQPPLPTRLMAGLAILKHTLDFCAVLLARVCRSSSSRRRDFLRAAVRWQH